MKELLFGEFRISLLRTLAARPLFRVLVSRKFALKGAHNIRFEKPGFLHLGTEYAGFVDSHVRSLLRISGELVLQGSVRVGRGNSWDVCRGSRLSVGDGTYFSPYVRIVTTNGITIGDRCAVGWGTQILDDDFHKVFTDSNTVAAASPTNAPVTIGNHVWVGSNVQILKGAKIASGCVVAAGSVVTGSFTEEGTLIAGIPARVVKRGVRWE